MHTGNISNINYKEMTALIQHCVYIITHLNIPIKYNNNIISKKSKENDSFKESLKESFGLRETFKESFEDV